MSFKEENLKFPLFRL